MTLLLNMHFGPNYEHFFFPPTVAYSVFLLCSVDLAGSSEFATKHLGRCTKVDMCGTEKYKTLNTNS